MDDESATVLRLYEKGEVSEPAAHKLLGHEGFDTAMEKARGSTQVLSGDTS